MSGSNSGLMSALMDPGVQTLAGFASGMAQAAMPSRLPVPFGAALGMGAAGAMQGAGNSLAMQQQYQQLRAQQLQNQFQQAVMPTRLALINGVSSTSGGGAPFGAPASGGRSPSITAGDGNASTGAPSSPGGTPAASGGGSSRYLVDPQATLAMARYALASGDDRAAATLMASLETEAGGAGYAMGPNGTAFAVQGGGKDQGVISGNAAAQAAGAGAGGLPYKIAAQQSQAALDRGNAAFKAAYGNPITFTGPGPDGSNRSYTVPAKVWYQPGGLGGIPGSSDQSSAPAAPSSSSPSGTISSDTYAQRVAASENGTGNSAAFNASGPGGTPTSTAVGDGQFTQGTWLPLFKQAFPDQASKYSDQQILALRSDPTWSSAMTVALARQNASTLKAAGVPVNSMTLGMAHLLGAGGAEAVMTAPPDAPLANVLPQQDIAANPSLARQTVGMFRGNMTMRFGNAPVDLGAPGGGAALPGGTPSDGNPYPGAIPGAPVMTPEQTSVSQAYGDEGKSILDANTKAPDELQKLDVLASAATGFRPGATGNMRLDAARTMVDALQSLDITPPKWLTDGAASGETIGKEGMQLAVELTRSLGSREAMGVLQMIKNVMPNVQLSQGGFQVILNGIRQGVLRDQDLSRFYENWMADPSHNGSWAGGEAAFDKQDPPEAYASRVVAMPAPKSPSDAQANVIYQTPKGPMLYTGTGWLPAAGQTALAQ